MKSIFTIACLFIITTFCFAQAPQAFNYSAVVRNGSGTPIPNQLVKFRLSILRGTITGPSVYVETHSTTTDANGMVNLEIGRGTIVSGVFAAIPWNNDAFFFQVEVDPTGGNTFQLMGTTQFLSVPYALNAKESEKAITADTSRYALNGSYIHHIGEYFEGGIIFHLYKENNIEHGLIVSLNDIQGGVPWSNVNNVLIGSSAQSSWDGESNTNAIVNQAGHTNSAALSCKNYQTGIYDDWYLPSVDEIVMVYNNRFDINKALDAIPNTDQLSTSQQYNTSTEINSTTAFLAFFNIGSFFGNGKAGGGLIRPVRKF
ncbi:MAG TPA: hypothetical protein PLU17_13330 [Chitinophagaceae bacterium]|nr:hypothetical protein [Chitinophagaceae bacterium]